MVTLKSVLDETGRMSGQFTGPTSEKMEAPRLGTEKRKELTGSYKNNSIAEHDS